MYVSDTGRHGAGSSFSVWSVSVFLRQNDMIQIQDVVVSLDVFREKFLCDLSACKGECCIEGDAGAPVEPDEVAELEAALPAV